jgi:hypothetical protein
MPVLANARYERFAQIVADGKLTPTGAYRETLGTDARDPDVNSCRWMKKPPTAERIGELKAMAADKCSLSRETYIKSLVDMYEAKPSEASMDNPRCDVVVVRGQKQAVFPPKLQVGQQLAKLVNWESSIKVELEAGENLADFLGRLFVSDGTLGSRKDSDGENGEGIRRTSSPASGARH